MPHGGVPLRQQGRLFLEGALSLPGRGLFLRRQDVSFFLTSYVLLSCPSFIGISFDLMYVQVLLPSRQLVYVTLCLAFFFYCTNELLTFLGTLLQDQFHINTTFYIHMPACIIRQGARSCVLPSCSPLTLSTGPQLNPPVLARGARLCSFLLTTPLVFNPLLLVCPCVSFASSPVSCFIYIPLVVCALPG